MPQWIVPTSVSRICIIHQRYTHVELMHHHDFQHLLCPLIRFADKLNTLTKKPTTKTFFFFKSCFSHADVLLYWLKHIAVQSLNIFWNQSSGKENKWINSTFWLSLIVWFISSSECPFHYPFWLHFPLIKPKEGKFTPVNCGDLDLMKFLTMLRFSHVKWYTYTANLPCQTECPMYPIPWTGRNVATYARNWVG